MACLKPFTRIVKNKNTGLVTEYPNSSCAKCRGCRKELRRQWYMRMMLESGQYDKNCFITVTFNEDYLKKFGHSLNKVIAAKFIRRLRRKGYKFRYFLVGEYGDKTKRPHYHAVLFGVDFKDSKSYPVPGNYYSHPDLDDAWGFGFCTIGEVTPASIKYCSHYVMKRFVSRTETAKKYLREGGEIVDPEFSLKSTRPALGYNFFSRFESQLAAQQTVVVDGLEMLMPKYFFRKLQEDADFLERCSRRDLLRFPLSPKELKRYIHAQRINFVKDESFQIFSEESQLERDRILDVEKRKATLEEQHERNSAHLKFI